MFVEPPSGHSTFKQHWQLILNVNSILIQNYFSVEQIFVPTFYILVIPLHFAMWSVSYLVWNVVDFPVPVGLSLLGDWCTHAICCGPIDGIHVLVYFFLFESKPNLVNMASYRASCGVWLILSLHLSVSLPLHKLRWL